MVDTSFLTDKKNKIDTSFLTDKKIDTSFLTDKKRDITPILGQPTIPTNEQPKLAWTPPAPPVPPRQEGLKIQKKPELPIKTIFDISGSNVTYKKGGVQETEVSEDYTHPSAILNASRMISDELIKQSVDPVNYIPIPGLAIAGKSVIGYLSKKAPKIAELLKSDIVNLVKRPIPEAQVALKVPVTPEVTIPKTEITPISKELAPIIKEAEVIPTKLGKPTEKVVGEIDPYQTLITKINTEIKPVKLSRAEQESVYHQRKIKQAQAMANIPKEIQGAERIREQEKILSGKFFKVESKPLDIKQDEFQLLTDKIYNSNIGQFDKFNTAKALEKWTQGGLLTEGEIGYIENVFGKGTLPIHQKVTLTEVLNVPRAIMASFDMSFPLRQGIFLSGRKEFYPAMKEMVKSFGSEKSFQAVQGYVKNHPLSNIAKESGLNMTDIGASLKGREEQFIGGRLAGQIPILGKGVRSSNRAYTAMANKLRIDTFADIYNKAIKNNPILSDDMIFQQDLAKYINTATGRGNLTKFTGIDEAAPLLNALLFSPRLMASRMSLLNPMFYVKLHPNVRKESLKDLARFISIQGTVLGLAKLGGANIGLDPRSSDFGKIKVGNTRFDTWGGFQQYAVLMSRLATQEMVSSTTGKKIEFGKKYTAPTTFSISLRFLESKEAPVASFFSGLAKGKDASGKPFSISKEVINRFKPMFVNDLIDIAKEEPKLLPFGLLGGLGVGVQTYESKPKQPRVL